MTEKPLVKIFKIFLFIILVVAFGSTGFIFIEGYSIIDAVYMTVITLTTTGFGDVVPKTPLGKYFTMVLLLSGMGVVTYCISTIVSYITSIDFSKRRREKMEKRISEFKKHTIVCGFGRMGEIICKRLKSEGVQFVVIEKDLNLISMLKKTDYYFLEGDAAHDDILIKAGIKNAKVLVSVIDSDADGLYITLAAKSFNENINIIVRANEPSAENRMIRAGANRVVLPYVMSGLKVAETVINPAVEDFFRIPDTDGSTNEYIQVADLHVTERSIIVGKKLSDIGKQLEGLIIVGVRKADHSFVFKPRGAYVFELGDCLITMGEGTHHKAAQENFCLDVEPPSTYNKAA